MTVIIVETNLQVFLMINILKFQVASRAVYSLHKTSTRDVSLSLVFPYHPVDGWDEAYDIVLVSGAERSGCHK